MFKRTTLLVTAVFAIAATSALGDSPVKGPFAGTVHAVANITYTDGSQQSWNWDRGKITALDSSSITLTRRDKAQVSFAITSSTIVRNDGATYSLTDLQVGQVATVVSQNGNADIIRNIHGPGAPTGGSPSQIKGPAVSSVTGTIDALYVDGSQQSFDYNRGRIMSVGSGQLTIMRPDKQQVQLTYDSTTVVRDCHGQAESTDSLAVGDGAMFVSQSGALKLAACLHQPKDNAGAAQGSQPQALPAVA